MTKKPKKVRRIVLGMGHPWFYTLSAGQIDKIALTDHRNGAAKRLRVPANIGNWNKVRLVLEVLK